MQKLHIRIVGGWCGNRMIIIRDYLEQLIMARGYQIKIDYQSVWESSAVCPTADLMLQLIPAFKQEDVHCPLLNVRPFLRDLDHEETIAIIFDNLEKYYPLVENDSVTLNLSVETLAE